MNRILHIDDSGFQRRISGRMFNQVFDNIELISLSDAEVLELTNKGDKFENIDLVVTDLLMENISGQEVIKYIREVNRECCIAVLSSNIQNTEKNTCFSLGADFFIEKPLSIDKLMELKGYYNDRI